MPLRILSSNLGARVDGRPYRDKRGTPYDRASHGGRARDVVEHTATMSWKALDWATESDIRSPTTKFILHLLANKADEDFFDRLFARTDSGG